MQLPRIHEGDPFAEFPFLKTVFIGDLKLLFQNLKLLDPVDPVDRGISRILLIVVANVGDEIEVILRAHDPYRLDGGVGNRAVGFLVVHPHQLMVLARVSQFPDRLNQRLLMPGFYIMEKFIPRQVPHFLAFIRRKAGVHQLIHKTLHFFLI